MKCERCGIEYPHKKGRFCGSCVKSPRMDVIVQIERDCPECGGEGCIEIQEGGEWKGVRCHFCKGAGRIREWISLVTFQEMLSGEYRPV